MGSGADRADKRGKYPQLINPPGSETGPGQIVTRGKSTVCSVDAFGYKFEWTTNSSKHIPFDWAGPTVGMSPGLAGAEVSPYVPSLIAIVNMS
jgi:hypothetical protein